MTQDTNPSEPKQIPKHCDKCGGNYLYPRWTHCMKCAPKDPPQGARECLVEFSPNGVPVNVYEKGTDVGSYINPGYTVHEMREVTQEPPSPAGVEEWNLIAVRATHERNALLDTVERLQCEAMELRAKLERSHKALREYGDHVYGCESQGGPAAGFRPCTCGYDKALGDTGKGEGA